MGERREPAGRRWLLWLGLITLAGLGVRLAAVFGRPVRLTVSDAYYYHNSANALAEGLGFINPFDYYLHHAHQHVATAAFPPMFTFLLLPASLVGFKSFLAHRVWTSIIGTAGIVVCGYAAKEIGGRRTGLAAAALVAVYPNLWMSDALVLSEALSPLVVGLVLLAAYRFWRRPRLSSVAFFGFTLGVAALTRDELTLLTVLVLLPLALLAKLSWRRRLGLLGAGGLVAALVVAPWVGYNLSRFKQTTFISTGLGATLVSANCHATWYGPYEGYWSFPCALRAPIKPKSAQVDESVQDIEGRHIAWTFIKAHAGRIPEVALARIGRAFGLFRPFQQVHLDASVENRPYGWALTGLWMYYALCPLAVGGLVVLRRRRVPVFPLLAVGLVVVISVVVTFGQTRYRSTFEVSLVILAAEALARAWELLRGAPAGAHRARGRRPGTHPPAQSDGSSAGNDAGGPPAVALPSLSQARGAVPALSRSTGRRRSPSSTPPGTGRPGGSGPGPAPRGARPGWAPWPAAPSTG